MSDDQKTVPTNEEKPEETTEKKEEPEKLTDKPVFSMFGGGGAIKTKAEPKEEKEEKEEAAEVRSHSGATAHHIPHTAYHDGIFYSPSQASAEKNRDNFRVTRRLNLPMSTLSRSLTSRRPRSRPTRSLRSRPLRCMCAAMRPL